jgi:hypothetical protein
VTASFKSVLTANGIRPEKISIVRNGADLRAFTPGPKPAALVERCGLRGKFVAAYIGTVGMAHGLATVLDAAERLRADARISFLIVGDGAERAALEAQAERRGLHNTRFVGPIGKEDIGAYWRLADVALVLLRDHPVFRHVLPSKMFEAMASGKPIVLGVLGESAELLARANAGVVVPPEDAAALADALVRLCDGGGAAELGMNGRRFVEAELDRDKLAAQMLHELRTVANM